MRLSSPCLQMKVELFMNRLMPLILIASLVVISACKDDDNPVEAPAATRELVGSWEVTITTIQAGCGQSGGFSTCMEITRVGEEVTMTWADGSETFIGTMTGEFHCRLDMDCCCPIAYMDLTVSANNEALTGSRVYECPDTEAPGCTLIQSITGTRQPGGC